MPGYDNSNTFSINASGQIAGWIYRSDFSSQHAALWEKGRPGVDLNTVVPAGSELELIEADVITDTGVITGFGVLPNGDEHAFLLVPDEGEGHEAATEIAARSDAAPAVPGPATPTHTKLTPERFGGLRGRSSNRHRGFGIRPLKSTR